MDPNRATSDERRQRPVRRAGARLDVVALSGFAVRRRAQRGREKKVLTSSASVEREVGSTVDATPAPAWPRHRQPRAHWHDRGTATAKSLRHWSSRRGARGASVLGELVPEGEERARFD